MKRLLLSFSCTALFITLLIPSFAQKSSAGKKISPDLFGVFFEDINYAADGGLYAELIQNRSFEYSPTERKEWNPLSYWEYVNPGFSYGQVNIETNASLHVNNPHYIVLNIEHVGKEEKHTGESGIGIKNSGFNGIVVRKGEKYNFSLFAKQLSQQPVSLTVFLQNQKGEILAQSTFSTNSGDWKRYNGTLTSAQSFDTASLVLLATTTGKLAIDIVSLFPEKTFNNRPNGLRTDLAQYIADMKPRFVRFPGGCLVHGDGLGNMYRWKTTIGPIEQRIEQRNIWGYHQTAGLGYFEYFQFCEDIGAKPVPILPAAVSCQNSGGTWRIGGTGQKALPLTEMKEYIEEVLDLIEWANGPVNSTWGAKRAEAGHPEPFNLEYIGVGNEDKMTPEFSERFKMIYDAIKAKYPKIIVIGTSGPFHSGEDFEKGWTIANELKVPVIDEHYYTNPDWFISNHYRYDQYNRDSSQVYLGEYASWGNKLGNAIAEASYMISLERNGDIVRMASYAPLLAKDNFTQWKTDMIFFDNVRVSLTPNYYVQKLFSANQGDIYFSDVIVKDNRDSALAASCVQDTRTGDIILKMVNYGKESKVMKVNLSRFKKILPNAEKSILTGSESAENTLASPTTIVPLTTTYTVSKKFDYSAAPMSLTVIRIRTK